MISAEVICDSISPAGKRLTTFKLRYPKFIHGEFMTHRVLSRNASSSRAIPTAKLIEEVRSDTLRAAPVFWGKNQAGMQAAVELEGYPTNKEFKNGAGYISPKQEVQIAWTRAAMNAAHEAEKMLEWGAHKQIVNRLLEPFSHINVVATATEWDNFFGLRLHHMAQPEMRTLAEVMWKAREASTQLLLRPGQWHLPFVDEVIDLCDDFLDWPVKVSVARCARVSYESFETGKRSTIEEDLKVYARLNLPGSATYDPLQPIHASPAEHQATPDNKIRFEQYQHHSTGVKADFYIEAGWQSPEHHGNFVGWRQYRKTLAGESCAPLPKEYQV